MKRFTFKKIDAFATGLSSGNPAGAVYLKDHEEITAQEMQRIAYELKGFVSEVGYVKRSDKTTFDLRYYSSEREVDFCGHATVAIMYDLLRISPGLMDTPVITINTNKGRLLVENRVQKDDAVFISAPLAVFSEQKPQKEEIALSLGIHPDDISPHYPLTVVNAGLETLIVPIKTLDSTLSMKPEMETARGFCQKNGIDIITVFTEETSENIRPYRTRVFAPTFGYLEDPATGSGNAAFGYYLLAIDRWDGTCISLEQNGELEKPNIVRIEARHDPGLKPRVLFGGSAVVRIEGEYILV
jgi:PhzF family phenazine biosynthesis protein